MLDEMPRAILCPRHTYQKSSLKPVPEKRHWFMTRLTCNFGTEFFRYRFSITNRTLLYFHAGLWYCVLNMLTSIRRSTCTELCCVVFDFSCNVLFCYFFLCFGFFLLPLMANKVVCTSFLVRVFGADFWHVCHGH